jgi:hypothetical protein
MGASHLISHHALLALTRSRISQSHTGRFYRSVNEMPLPTEAEVRVKKQETAMANMREMIAMGISLAVAVLAAVIGGFVWITLPLLVLAALLFAWALEPERTEAFVGRLPYSNYLLKALAKLDLVLPGRKLREP